MKKFMLIFIFMFALTPIVLLILDFINITNYINITEKYDWLNFIGTYISGLATLTLGYIAFKQNESLSKVNDEMRNDSMVSKCYSQIEIETKNYYDANIRQYKLNDYGLKMYNIDKGKKVNKYNKIILHVVDNKNLSLTKGKINELVIEFDDKEEKHFEYKYEGTDEVKLEVAPQNNSKTDNLTYYLPIFLMDDEDNLKKIYEAKKLRITFHMSIKNVFNVRVDGEYTIIVSKRNTQHGDWTEYDLNGRKIYYDRIVYEEESNEYIN